MTVILYVTPDVPDKELLYTVSIYCIYRIVGILLCSDLLLHCFYSEVLVKNSKL